MIYNVLPLFSLNIQSGFIADADKPIEILVYSFSLSVNCIFEFQGTNLWTYRIFFYERQYIFLVLLSIITREVRCCRVEDLMKRFFCEDWVIDKRMYGKIAWEDGNYGICTGDLTLKHHEWSRSSSSSLFSRNALEVSATGFDQTISKLKVNFSINHM